MKYYKRYEDAVQAGCIDEAIDFIIDNIYNRNNKKNPKCYSVWFAFISGGYKTMITTEDENANIFFEVTKKCNGEIRCDCFHRFEYIVVPSDAPAHILPSDSQTPQK